VVNFLPFACQTPHSAVYVPVPWQAKRRLPAKIGETGIVSETDSVVLESPYTDQGQLSKSGIFTEDYIMLVLPCASPYILAMLTVPRLPTRPSTAKLKESASMLCLYLSSSSLHILFHLEILHVGNCVKFECNIK